jgi:hypothetical protein
MQVTHALEFEKILNLEPADQPSVIYELEPVEHIDEDREASRKCLTFMK